MSIGIDLVYLPAFSDLLEIEGSRFGVPGAIFSSHELRRAKAQAKKKADGVAPHLGALWAMKEAVLKAWVSALEEKTAPLPLKAEEVLWSQIRILHHASGAPFLQMVGEMEQAYLESLGRGVRCAISASHDGDYVIGTAIICS